LKQESQKKAESEMSPSRKVANGLTYRKLRPEAKATLEKIVYQMELLSKTLLVLEQRIIDSEDKLFELMTFIKTNDMEYQPQTANTFLGMTNFEEGKGAPF
jgi:hypothetical protein